MALIPVQGRAQNPEDLLPKLTRPKDRSVCSRAVNFDVAPSKSIQLRQGPGEQFKSIDKITGGTSVRVVAHHKGWFEIDGYADSPYTIGWIDGKFLKPSQSGKPQDLKCLGLLARMQRAGPSVIALQPRR
jgi:hypothetical protein